MKIIKQGGVSIEKSNMFYFMSAYFFFISGCNSMNFSKKSTETGTYVNDEVSLEIKNDSIDNSGLVLLISNKTNTDLTYDSTYYIEQKRMEFGIHQIMNNILMH